MSSVSRAELEAMDRDELIEEIAEMSSALENVRAVLDTSLTKRQALEDRVDTLEERTEVLEDENQRLRERLDESDQGQNKIEAIVEYALNKQHGRDVVKLTAEEIVGATGYSELYAYQLLDDLPGERDWILSKAEMQQYGSIEMDLSSQKRAIGIDIEGVHSAGVPLNQFNNDRGGEQ